MGRVAMFETRAAVPRVIVVLVAGIRDIEKGDAAGGRGCYIEGGDQLTGAIGYDGWGA